MPPRARRPSRAHPPGPARDAVLTNGGGPSAADGEAREIEWQLTAPDLAAVRRWLDQHASLDQLSIQPLPAQQLHDTYLDTEDWRLLRAGFALRLRNKGGRVEATLKGLRSARDDVADRREITEPLAVAGSGTKALAHATGPVGSRVHDVAGVKPLRTLFEVRTSRQRFAVRTENSRADVGEIALDEARFSRADGQRRPMLLTRVELEAVGADSAPLERLASRLRSECGLRPASENKFAVGLRSASLAPPRGAGPDREAEPAPPVMDSSSRAGDFAAAALRRLLKEWQANEPAARLGEGPEPLHRLRVTCRRMDTVLTLFRAYLPARLRNNRTTLKGLLDALGNVRDADIRLETVASFRDSLPEADRTTLDPLLQHLRSERARARASMLHVLDAKHTRRWLDTLPDELARTVSPGPTASPRNAAALTLVPELIDERYRKLRKCARRLTPKSPLTEFHKVRIRTKKLRYALEVVAPTYRKAANKVLAALNKLQSRLGTQHDADVAARYLTQLAKDPPADFTAATVFMMGRMTELHATRAARLGRKIEKPWRKVRGRRWKALRSRMQALRDDARKRNKKLSAVHYSAGDDGRLASHRGNGAFPSVDGNGRLHSALARWTPLDARRH